MIVEGPVKFGEFIVLYRVGAGGMGEVYRAVKIGPGGFEKDVALKVINADISSDSEFRKMFMREAKIAAKLQHPNVVSVYELGMAGGTLYMSMEYINGVTLNRLLTALREKGEKLTEEEAAYILYSTCLALSSAHNFEDTTGEVVKVIHRDVTPHNIFISYSGEVKLGDFGVAKVIGYAYTEMTQKGVVKGKLSYMSPEQMRGDEIDERSDFYSIGIVGLEMLLGRKVFSSFDLSDVGSMKRLLDYDPDEFSGPFREFFSKTLCEEREKRFKSAEEICSLFSRNYELEMGRKALRERVNTLFSDLRKEEEEKQKRLRLSDNYQKIKRDILTRLGGEHTLVLGRKRKSRSPLFYAGAVFLGLAVSALLVTFTFLLRGKAEKVPLREAKKVPQEKVIQLPEKRTSLQGIKEKKARGKSTLTLSRSENPVQSAKGERETRRPPEAVNRKSGEREEKFAILSIESEPWGYVFINGKNTKKKTPLRELALEPGSFVITVVNPISGIVGMKKVVVRKGERRKILFKNKKEVTP